MRRRRDQDSLPAGQQTSHIPHCDSRIKGRETLCKTGCMYLGGSMILRSHQSALLGAVRVEG